MSKDTSVQAALDSLEGIKTWAAMQDTVGYPRRAQTCPIATWLCATVVGLGCAYVCQEYISLQYVGGGYHTAVPCAALQELEAQIDASEYEDDEAIPAGWLLGLIARIEGEPQ